MSKRFQDYPKIRAAFIQFANVNHYSKFNEIYPYGAEVSEFSTKYENEVMTCKLMALYHELAHLLFQRDPEKKSMLEDMVISNMKNFISDYGEGIYKQLKESNPKRITIDYLKKVHNQFIIRDKKYKNLIEEMAADLYAISKTHATLFLNIEPKNSMSASDAILSGVMVYYSSISTYERVCSFWDAIIPHVLLHKNTLMEKVDNRLKVNEEFAIIRAQQYPLILLNIVYKLDIEKWSSEDYTGFKQRLNGLMKEQIINSDWSLRAFESINNESTFQSILGIANDVDIENHKYELDILPKDELIISWISNQYHNNKGLRLLNEEKRPYEAMREFANSIIISKEYLGENHRFTARAYNNAVTALLELHKITEANTYLLIAKQYSDIALGILKNDYSIGYNGLAEVLQNAGVIAQFFNDHEKAIAIFSEAKKEKYYITGGKYHYSIAVSDSSLAISYLSIGRKKDARKLCKKVLRYLEENELRESDIYTNTLQVYRMCRFGW